MVSIPKARVSFPLRTGSAVRVLLCGCVFSLCFHQDAFLAVAFTVLL